MSPKRKFRYFQVRPPPPLNPQFFDEQPLSGSNHWIQGVTDGFRYRQSHVSFSKRIRSACIMVDSLWEATSIVLPLTWEGNASKMDFSGSAVQSGSRLIQDENIRIFNQGPGNRQSLFLAFGQIKAFGADHGFIFCGSFSISS